MTTHLDRLAAALADRYTLERQLGQGGMATVYLAHDLKHDRKVAIKVLRPELAAVLGAERFVQEIKTTANLQHPNILPLFDSGEADGFLYYVMPYVEGETLRGRLDREKQLAVDESVRIVQAVAAALQYAHEHGIVHRDIKPENILFQAGQAVVADFGIARAVTQAGGVRLTETGLSIGTPTYMSPEQAAGERDLDSRTDVYSLAAVSYEMLAGEPPHGGSTAQAIIARVFTEAPVALESRRPSVPGHVAHAVHQALEKLPADRFGSASAFAAALSGTDTTGRSMRPTSARPSLHGWMTDWRTLGLAAIAMMLILAQVQGGPPEREPSAVTGRFVVSLPESQALLPDVNRPIALSPDGTRLVYVGRSQEAGESGRQLYVRSFDALDPKPIVGTEGASAPFFSPNGDWIGFYVGARIRRVPLDGGTPQSIADSARTFIPGAVWLADNSVVYPSGLGTFTRTAIEGGQPAVIFRDTAGFVGAPAALAPGYLGFWSCPANSCIEAMDAMALDLRTGEAKPLVEGFGRAAPQRSPVLSSAAPGYLLLAQPDGDALWAAPFDPERLTVLAPPRAIMEGMVARGVFAVSPSGTLVHFTGGAADMAQLVLVDRTGAQSALMAEERNFLWPRLSPDGRLVAIEIHDANGGHIWVYDRDAGTLTRITTDGHNAFPVWSPDGRWITYMSSRDTLAGFYRVPVDRSEPARLLYATGYLGVRADVSPDGRWIAFVKRDRFNSAGIFVAAADGTGTPVPVVESPASQQEPAFSPDGRWMAFEGDESGTTEVYLRRFPGPEGRWTVSSGGGQRPVWSHAGNEIFYVGADGGLYAAAMDLERQPRVVRREKLFETSGFLARGWHVHPNDREFVFLRPTDEPVEIVVVFNWFKELERITGR